MAFIHKNPGALPADRCDGSAISKRRLKKFIKLIDKKMRLEYESPSDLESKVTISLIRLMTENPALGWTRTDDQFQHKTTGTLSNRSKPEVLDGISIQPKYRKLPDKRKAAIFESRVGGHKVILRVGEYSDGSPGEIDIEMHKEGAAFRNLLGCFSQSVSIGLQHGISLEYYVEHFTFVRFEPQGVCDHPNIRMVTSIIDYVFRVLALEYCGVTDYCQVKPEVARIGK